MKNYLKGIGRAAVGLMAGGMVLSSSCSSRDIRTVVSGVNAVVDVVNNPNLNSSSDLAGFLVNAFGN